MLALMQYLRVHGLVVSPFKADSDFLDPMWHESVCGRTSYNLDTRMMGTAYCRRLFAKKAAGADVCILEGMMDLFDGAADIGGEGSSIDLARVLNEDV